ERRRTPARPTTTPVRNEEARIGPALQALATLRARGAEVIVADGGSRDRTVEIARPLADRLVPAPRGRGRANDARCARFTGHVLVFLDADPAVPPGRGAL